MARNCLHKKLDNFGRGLMEEIDVNSSTPLCLSARAEVGNSAVFGVIAGTVEKPQVAYLKQVQPLEVIKKL
jgi:hypothetical protein